MEGNEALARGAIAAGCNFFAGYPITPATTIFNNMLKMLPAGAVSVCRVKMRLPPLAIVSGHPWPGKKHSPQRPVRESAFTASRFLLPSAVRHRWSSPMFNGSALRRVLPPRGPTATSMFLRWGSTGGVPVIVLAPKDVRDCYLLAVHAFNFAEEFRCPVFIASNKEIGLTKQSVDLDSISLPPIINRRLFGGTTYLPFAAAPGEAPPFLPIGGRTLVRITSSTHGADGFITNDPEVIARNQERLREKIESAAERITLFEEDIKDNSEILIISYGVTSCAVDDAVAILEKSGIAVSTLVLKTLWPVPEQLLREKARPFRRIVVFEMNLGQYVREIRRVLGDKTVEFYGQMDGVLISPRKIVEVIANG